MSHRTSASSPSSTFRFSSASENASAKMRRNSLSGISFAAAKDEGIVRIDTCAEQAFIFHVGALVIIIVIIVEPSVRISLLPNFSFFRPGLKRTQWIWFNMNQDSQTERRLADEDRPYAAARRRRAQSLRFQALSRASRAYEQAARAATPSKPENKTGAAEPALNDRVEPWWK
jgi:hypothetical protein